MIFTTGQFLSVLSSAKCVDFVQPSDVLFSLLFKSMVKFVTDSTLVFSFIQHYSVATRDLSPPSVLCSLPVFRKAITKNSPLCVLQMWLLQ